jgi:hypothetical protein
MVVADGRCPSNQVVFAGKMRSYPVYNASMGERLPHLETFSKAAELSSFTAAAKVLGLSQPAVSQQVQALEKLLRAFGTNESADEPQAND